MSTCYCGASAEYTDSLNPYSSDYCSSSFVSYIEKKILKGVPRKLKGHPIARALSEGKDSLGL
ncbi:MAG: hypothetical protein ACW98F_04435 [Candidatus Hodarchaeales archaeon]